MSGIAGVVDLRGDPAGVDADLDTLVAGLAPRHVKEVHAASDAHCAMAAIDSTFDPLAERGGLVQGSHGDLAVADVRLDDRARAQERFGGERDAATFIAAWQAGLAQRLAGDVAAAWWDPRQRALRLRRDPFGVRPLYWAQDKEGHRVAFCTEPAPLMALDWTDASPDEEALDAFTKGVLPAAPATFRRGLHRVPPGHELRFAGGAPTPHCWWSPWQIGLDGRMDLETAASGFQERLKRAIADRMEGHTNAAAALSGGLDSSLVAAHAAMLRPDPVAAYTLRFPATPEADEGRYSDAVRAHAGLAGRDIDGSALDLAAFHDRFEPDWGLPAPLPNVYLHDALYRAAADDGATLFLDGFDGDTTIGHGLGHIADLMRQGHRRQAMALVDGLAASHGRPARTLRRRLAWTPWVASRGRPRWTGAFPHGSDAWQMRRKWLDPALGHALEVADAVAARHGIRPSYPFCDQRLVEACLQVPGRHRLQDSHTRAFARAASTDVLPGPVRRRASKSDLSGTFRTAWNKALPNGQAAPRADALPDWRRQRVQAAKTRRP